MRISLPVIISALLLVGPAEARCARSTVTSTAGQNESQSAYLLCLSAELAETANRLSQDAKREAGFTDPTLEFDDYLPRVYQMGHPGPAF